MEDSLSALIRRVDEDRWLASRFASADVRAKLIAIYAVNYEIARASTPAREPGIGAIKLAWWRDALAELAQGKTARAHPALEALQRSGGVGDADAWTAMIEARARDLDDAPFENAAALETYVDATAGAVMRLAVRACAPADATAFVVEAGRAWGYAGLARNGRRAPVDLAARAQSAHGRARALGRTLPSALFPAIGYVALVPNYLRALAQRRAPPTLLARQTKLVFASASGRL